MTNDSATDGTTGLTTIMESYTASLRANPDLGFLSFLKIALRKNDSLSEELTDWLVESWWGLMADAQEMRPEDSGGQGTRKVAGKYTAPEGLDEALLARLMQMRIHESTEELSSKPGVPPRLRPSSRADGYMRPHPMTGKS